MENNADYQDILWLQVVFFGIFIWGITAIIRPELVGIKDVVNLVFPITFKQYWYFTAYSVLFFVMPMLNIFVDKLTEKEGRKVLLACFLVFSCYGVLNCRYSDSLHLLKGYSAIWLAILYVVGALFRKFQWNFQTKKVFGMLMICWLGGWLWRVKLSNMIGYKVENLVLNYVSPVMFVMAICFFVLFLNIGKENKIVKAISVSTFGAYLFQEQYIFRDNFLKRKYMYLAEYEPLHMVAMIIILSVSYFIVGILIDKIRMVLFKIFKIHDFSLKIENLINSGLEFGSRLFFDKEL